MKKLISATGTIIAIVVGIQTSSTAQTNLPLKSVSIFKNGTCMFTKEGTLPLKDGVLRLPVPNAINSTYWINTPGEKLIKSISYKDEKIKVQRDVSSLHQLLELNIGKTISFVLNKHQAQPNINTTDGGIHAAPQLISGKILGVNHALNKFKISDKSGVRYFPIGDILNTDITIEDALDKQQTDSVARYAVVTPTKELSEMKIQELSLQSGVQWIPSYALKLGVDTVGRIEMKALIENFSGEPISNTDAEVIVGVPQLYYSSVLDPAVSTTYTSAASNIRSGFTVRGGRSAETQVIVDGMSVSDNFAGGLGNGGSTIPSTTASQLEADRNYTADVEQGNNIFVYKLGNITVEKSSKTHVPVFAVPIEYKDIHDCIIPDFTNFEHSRQVGDNRTTYDVFHSIELRNTTNYPLTTAGIIVTDENNRFLAQDLLKYIPKGGKGNVRLSKEINVTVKCAEEELNRTENVKKIYKVYYNRVRIKGATIVENFNEKTLTVKIVKSINGSVVNADQGKVRKLSESFTVNPQSEVTWEVTVKPGEKKEISYEYDSLFER